MKSGASGASGLISTLTSAPWGTSKRARNRCRSAAIVSASYVFGVPPPKKTVVARKGGLASISASSALR